MSPSTLTEPTAYDAVTASRPDRVVELPSAERKRRTSELITRARSAEDPRRTALLDEAIVLNIPVARSLAARYRNRGQPMEDLDQVAYAALTRAVHDYTPDRGEDLLVYAVPTIRGELKRYFRDATWAVRPPRRLQELRARALTARERLRHEAGHEPTVAELAADLGCTAHDAGEALGCGDCSKPERLDLADEETGSSWIDRIGVVENGYDRSEAIAVLGPVCRRLQQRDRRILRLRFYEQLTQQEIADRLGVTQVQVSRLLRRILDELRSSIVGPAAAPAA